MFLPLKLDGCSVSHLFIDTMQMDTLGVDDALLQKTEHTPKLIMDNGKYVVDNSKKIID